MAITFEGEDITLAGGGSTVTLRPSRGGMVTRFDVGNTHVMFMDQESLNDLTKNVRGGNPVLFPSPGKLAGDAWAHGGKKGAMKQHGFARNLPWRVIGSVDGASPTVALELTSTPDTLAQFPWACSLQMTYSLRGNTLRVDQRVENRGDSPMPYGVGFHPYFFVKDADKKAAHVETKAKRAFDNVTKKPIDLTGIDLTQKEVDLHLLDHGSTESALTTPAGEIRLRGSAEYTHWVAWTLTGRDFVCLEPWTAPGDALNTNDRVLTLAPGQAHTLWLDMTFTSGSAKP